MLPAGGTKETEAEEYEGERAGVGLKGAVVILSPNLTPKGQLNSPPRTKCSLPIYPDSKNRRATSRDIKTKRRPGKNWERRKERKKGKRGREKNISRTISILYGAFCLKKNEKGMMEKGRESDKFNDVCSKLRLEK